MSKPLNPLDKFRSFSYHHILVVANSTEAIRQLSDPTLSVQQSWDMFNGMKLGEAKNPSAPYFLVCDTRKVSHFSINNLSYTSKMMGVDGSNEMTHTMDTLVEMQFTDATGVGFLNYLEFLTSHKLKVNIFHSVFFIKTFFVGHTDTEKTEIISQTGIPMMLIQMHMHPSHLGSTISATFSPVANGAVPRSGNFNIVHDIPGVYSKTKKLKDTVKSFEDALNQKSRTWYREVNIKKTNNDILNGVSTGGASGEGYGRLVQYMITLPESWNSFEVKGVYQNVTESKYSKDGKRADTESDGVYVGFNSTTDTSITNLLNLILRQSNEVQKLAGNDKREQGQISSYVINNSITSDVDTLTIHYDILELQVPKTPGNKTSSESVNALSKVPSFNQIEFDYIFTGKNTDIIEFDMKIENAQMAIADNISIGGRAQRETAKDQKDKSDDKTATSEKTMLMKFHEKDPVLLPNKTRTQLANMPWIFETDDKSDAIKSRQQFVNNVAQLAAISSVDSIIKIRGNPNLFNQLLERNILTHVKIPDNLSFNHVNSDESFIQGVGANNDFLSTSDVAKYKSELNDLTIRKNGQPQLLPFYVHVNVMGPDFNFLTGSAESALAEPQKYTQLWYKGWFIVQQIKHSFTNGDFTQEILLGANILDLYGQKTKE